MNKIFLIFPVFMLSVAHADLEDIVSRGELRVAVQNQGPPFSFLDKNNRRTGSAVELAELLAKEMGVRVQFQDFDWDGLIPALLSKKVDLIAADMTPTLQRSLKVEFARPFYKAGSFLVVKTGSQFKAKNDCAKPGARIAAVLGSSGEQDAKRLFPKASVKGYKGGGLLILDAVLKGYADCAINEYSSLLAQLAERPRGALKMIESQLSEDPLSFAIHPENSRLLSWVNRFFDTIERDGRLENNLHYWVKSLDWKKDH